MSLPLSLCKKCLKPIYWVVTEKGANMPVDNYPSDNGNIIFVNNLAHTLKKGEVVPEGTNRYKSHYATCPHAEHFRR